MFTSLIWLFPGGRTRTKSSIDIFFVISGYVISLLLLKDYKASETILNKNEFIRNKISYLETIEEQF